MGLDQSVGFGNNWGTGPVKGKHQLTHKSIQTSWIDFYTFLNLNNLFALNQTNQLNLKSIIWSIQPPIRFQNHWYFHT